jgi:hypothetical protein
MLENKVPESLQDPDDTQRRIYEMAVRLFRGEGGAGELARLIGEQAERNAKGRIEAARKRAALPV